MRYTFFLPLLSAVLASNPPAAYGQSDSASMKLGDITVTGTLRLRAYAWDWFTPATGNNNYAYSGNLLRLNFVEKHKGWDWDAELAASLLLGMPDNANAAAPQGALGLGSNYYSANGNRQYSGTVFAKQLYGRQNLEMNNALQQLGASVTPIVLYRWELPTDVEPLQMAARGLAQRRFDVVLFTSSIQLDHLMMVAKALGLELQVSSALREYTAIASVARHDRIPGGRGPPCRNCASASQDGSPRKGGVGRCCGDPCPKTRTLTNGPAYFRAGQMSSSRSTSDRSSGAARHLLEFQLPFLPR